MELHIQEALEKILGPKNCCFDDKKITHQFKSEIPIQNFPACVVYPSTTFEVQEVVRLANAKGLPIWPLSQGKNWGYGALGAPYTGGITMILEKMNRIICVDEKLGCVTLEPGVTYRQLNAHLKSNRIKLWADCTGSTADGSVIGNALDKGRGLTPYADHFANLCGLQVVLPSGDFLHTGGPVQNYHARGLYKGSIGPNVDGLFAQSSLGVVTQANVWLMPEPEAYDFMAFQYLSGEQDLYQMIDELRPLVFSGHFPSRPHLANAFAMLCIIDQYPNERASATCLTENELLRWQRLHGVADWTFGLGFYGSTAQVSEQKKRTVEVLSRYGRTWSFGKALDDDWRGRAYRWWSKTLLKLSGCSEAQLAQVLTAARLFQGIPTDDFVKQVYFKNSHGKPTGAFNPPQDGCGFIWLGPVLPFTGSHARKLIEASKKVFAKHEFDFFVEIIFESPRALIFLFGVFFDRSSSAESSRAQLWYDELRNLCLEMGYPPYRETISSTTHCLSNNSGMQEFIGKIKGALDPQNTIAPGRYGGPGL